MQNKMRAHALFSMQPPSKTATQNLFNAHVTRNIWASVGLQRAVTSLT